MITIFSDDELSIINNFLCMKNDRNFAYKKLLEYLFWMWDPSLPGGCNEPERILEEGFMDAENYLVNISN